MGKILSRLRHAGDRNFAILEERDGKFSHVMVNTIAERNAIPEWARMPKMECKVIEDGKTYELGLILTIAGQVWTELAGGDFVPLSSAGQPLGYVPLGADGKIDSSYLGSLFINNSTTVVDQAAMLALTTIQGDLVTVAEEGQSYYKLNNNDPSVLGDFQQILNGAAVTSVNGQVGVVSITIASLLSVAANVTAFNNAIASSPSVTEINAVIAQILQDISQLEAGEGVDLSNYFTKSEITAALDNKVDVEAGKGLSEANFTEAEKVKLAGALDRANHTGVDPISSIEGFAAAPNESSPAKGPNGEQIWIQRSQPKAFSVVKITGVVTYYDTLHAAVTGSVAGDTIEMFADYISTSVISIDKNLTINTNGNNIINESLSISSHTINISTSGVELNILGYGRIVRRGITSTTNGWTAALYSTTSGISLNIQADVINENKQAIVLTGTNTIARIYGKVTGSALDANNRASIIFNSSGSVCNIYQDVEATLGEAVRVNNGAKLIVHGNIIAKSLTDLVSLIGFNAASELTVYGNIIRPVGSIGAALKLDSNNTIVNIGGSIINDSGSDAILGVSTLTGCKLNFYGPPAHEGSVQEGILVTYIGDYGSGEGIPIGGTTGQVLAKASNTDGDVTWVNQTGGSGSTLVDVSTSYSIGTPLGINLSTGAIAVASSTVEDVMTVVETGKALVKGFVDDLGFAVGAYYTDEDTGTLTPTKPTAVGKVVKLSYIQGTGIGIHLWHAGYVIGELDTIDDGYEITT